MHNLPATVSKRLPNDVAYHNDPIIDREEVMWAARRFILLYGEKASSVVQGEVKRLDLSGELRVAEMFTRVELECQRLLQKSEGLRLRPVH
jgi:hypothetical protein